MSKEKIVMCFGTFDVLHLGHINYFKQAKLKGFQLVVVVARDKNIPLNKKVRHCEEDRLRLIQELKIVDFAILGDEKDKMNPIIKFNPELICLGYDQEIDTYFLQKELIKLGLKTKIKRLEPYNENFHKSSLIKRFCKK
ncbi:FAD synthase [Candidatus Woesearchaeota archaeon CG_4_10_14_0_2_um_filter_33_13]|nr:MAG: FAD synthase [Candidatus Woesearchaeota archaeon CG_4_10_14_0_2_um_filter_33_13]